MRTASHGGGGLFLNFKAERCRKAKSAQNAKSILRKALFRFSHGADDSLFEVFSAAVQIGEAVFRAITHRVDREIPSRKILGKRLREDHRLGMTVVLILTVYAVGGYLIGCCVQNHRQRSVLDSGFHGAHGGEDLLHLLGRCRGGDIDIEGIFAHQKISDTAAHDVRAVTVLFQRFNNIQNVTRKRKLHWQIPPFFILHLSIPLFCAFVNHDISLRSLFAAYKNMPSAFMKNLSFFM